MLLIENVNDFNAWSDLCIFINMQLFFNSNNNLVSLEKAKEKRFIGRLLKKWEMKNIISKGGVCELGLANV